jgi:PKD repeat protein
VEINSADSCVRARSSIGGLVLTALAVLLASAASAHAAPAVPAPETGYARVQRACPPPPAGQATCFALVRHTVPASEAGSPGVHPFKLRAGAASSGPAGGLTPAQLASAYGYDPSSGGSGQTVAIVDAFDDPSIEADLKKFDTEYGLAACTEVNKCFKKVGQTGETTSLPAADTSGWSVEIALDVEAVRATCPNCRILLVEARNPEFTNLAAATDTAVALGATEVSNSYGGPEAKVPAAEAAYDHPGVVIAAATGDFGWDSWGYYNEFIVPPVPARPDIPSTLPSVVSVGGTSLELEAGEKRAGETVWNGNGPRDSSEFVEGASGGGCSTLYNGQPWQQDAPGYPAAGCAGKRLNADVSAVADPLTGFDIFDSYNCGSVCEQFRNGKSWLTIGGTSLATPLISGMYGLAGGAKGVSYPALTLYGHLGGAALFDVTKGGNGFCDEGGKSCGINAAVAKEAETFHELAGVKLDCEGTTACNAATGFDGPSGVGAPASLGLFEPLLPTAAITLPAKFVVGTPLAFSAAASSDPYPGGAGGTTYSWTFGDGGTGSGIAPSHTYATIGKRTVTLTVTDGYGLKSVPKSVEIEVAEPSAQEIKEQEEAAKKKAEEEAAKKKAEEEAAKKKAEEEAAKHKAEEEAAKKKAEEEAAKKAEEEAAKHKAEEEAAKKKAEEEAAKHKAEEAAVRKKAEEEAASAARASEEAARKAAEALIPGAGSIGVAGFKELANPDATLSGSTLRAGGNGSFTVAIRCPAGETSCEGIVTVRTAGAVVASARARVLTLASGAFKVPGGKTVTVRLHLNRKARALLARRHTLRVQVTIASRDPAGASHTGVANASLRAPAKHR